MSVTPAQHHVLVDVAEGVATVTLNRPEKRNALSLELMRELIAASRRSAPTDGQAVILRGGARPSAPGTTCARCSSAASRTTGSLRHCVQADGDDPGDPAARDRRGRAASRPRRAASSSRPAISRSPRPPRVRHAGREDRAVLHDADGRADPRDRAQARDGDAAHRRADRRARPRPTGAWSTASCRPPNSLPRRANWRAESRRRPGSSSASARRRSTRRSISTSPGVRLRERSDVDERAGRGRAGRHVGFRRQARAGVALLSAPHGG